MPKIKKWTALLLALAVFILCFPAPMQASAEELPENEIPEEVQEPEGNAFGESEELTTLSASISDWDADLTLRIPQSYHADSIQAKGFEPEYELLESICVSMGVNVVLDYYGVDLSMPDVFIEYSESVHAQIQFPKPLLRSLGDEYTLVYAVNDGMIQRVASYAAVKKNMVTELSFDINTFDSSTRIVILTTDQPSLLLSASVNGNMAVQGIKKLTFGYTFGGSSKSCSIQGITYHWVGNQNNPAYCLEPNKTFAFATNGGASAETVGLGNSSSGRVGGNVWNSLSTSQRRAIALVALYGVPAGRWYSDGVAGNGNNTMYPTNANQCCFAAGQVIVWEIILGLRSPDAPYTLWDSKLIDNFDRGDVRMYYDSLVANMQAHDSATSTVPSPEQSTYSLTWVTSSNQTVMSVELIQYFTPAPKTVTVTVRKTSASSSGKQFTFRVFADAALTSQIGGDHYAAPGGSFSVELTPGSTYYIAEVKETGWQCTSGHPSKTLNAETYYYTSIKPTAGGNNSVTFNNEPVFNITLQKTIDASQKCIDQLADNAMYSLAGAKYTISVNGTVQETLTTDASGKAVSAKQYGIGTALTIQETVAPSGFALDTNTHSHKVVNGSNTVSVKDKPLMDPPFAMTKVDKDTTSPQGDGSFHGAVFKWEYFDNKNWSGTAKRTWYLKTNESGRSQYDASYLAEGYTSDALYVAANGSNQLPLGTVKITEVQNSLGYIVLKEPLYCSIAADSEVPGGVTSKWDEASLQTLINIATGNVGIYEPIDESLFGSLTMEKVDAESGSKPQGSASLGGALFQIINNSTNSVKVGDRPVAQPGEVCYEFTTDASGKASTGQILPLGKYSVKEVKAPDGYLLNDTWVQNFTVTAEKKDFAFTLDAKTACPDRVIRGGLRIMKQNNLQLEETDDFAHFEGITFSVTSNNENPVVVGDKTFRKGETVMTLACKWDGSKWIAETASNALPYGSYTVTENPMEGNPELANPYYFLNTQPQTITIGSEGQIAEVTFVNTIRPGSIRIEKVDTTGRHLTGASFCLLWSKDGQQWTRLTYSDTPGQMGCCTSEGLANGILKTNKDGIAEFTGLDPRLQYRLFEAEAPKGYTLLSEPVYEGSLPEQTVQLCFRVVNAMNFSLPQTGSHSLRTTAQLAALCTVVGILLLVKKRKDL